MWQLHKLGEFTVADLQNFKQCKQILKVARNEKLVLKKTDPEDIIVIIKYYLIENCFHREKLDVQVKI